jgi:hypothetical protein
MDKTISDLVSDVKNPAPSANWGRRYWSSWASSFLLMTVLTLWASRRLPSDVHLPENLMSVSFWIEAGLWFVLALLSAFIAYQSSMPTKPTSYLLRASYATSFLLAVSLLIRETPSSFASEFSNELHWHRGPCGAFILSTSLVSAIWMFSALRKAAPTRLSFTGAWTLMSVGSLSAMFMHLVCTRETSAHAIIWHIAPMLVLAMAGTAYSRRALRW